MSQDYLNNYLNNLTQQISVSVDKLKYKSSASARAKEDVGKEEGEALYNRASLHNYSYKLLATSSSYDINAYNSKEDANPNITHAIDSYNQVKTVNEEPKVLLDFMHKYNQNFDFRV